MTSENRKATGERYSLQADSMYYSTREEKAETNDCTAVSSRREKQNILLHFFTVWLWLGLMIHELVSRIREHNWPVTWFPWKVGIKVKRESSCRTECASKGELYKQTAQTSQLVCGRYGSVRLCSVHIHTVNEKAEGFMALYLLMNVLQLERAVPRPESSLSVVTNDDHLLLICDLQERRLYERAYNSVIACKEGHRART